MKKKNGIFKKILCGVLAAASLTVTVSPLYADTLDDLKKKQEELKQQQQELEKKSDDLNSKKDVTEDEIQKLENQLKELLDEIHRLDLEASELSSEIFETNKKLDAQIAIQEKQYNEMKLRIQYMYENKEADLTESVISSEGMAEFLNAFEYYQKIYDYDRAKLDEIEETRRQIETLKKQLEDELERVQKAEEEMSKKREEVAEVVSQKQTYLASINSDIAYTAESIASTQSQLNSNANAIAEEEARIAAEKERKRREAEAAAAAARAAASSRSSGTTVASSSSYSSSYAKGTAALVADYARNGVSSFPATAGWCAAWVSGVYNMAGVTPPHGNAIDYWNKWSYSGGTGYDVPVGACVISSGAGYDAIKYGHIGIYLGDGMVISNIGGLKLETIQSFDASATATCQGHRGYIGWVWPNGTPIQ